MRTVLIAITDCALSCALARNMRPKKSSRIVKCDGNVIEISNDDDSKSSTNEEVTN